MSLSAHLLIIDPQNDFMDIPAKAGDPVGATAPDGTEFRSTLPVPGACADMNRVAALVERVGPRLADIHVTMDSHHPVDVAHPAMWRDKDGKQPMPFTIISADDIESGIWEPRLRQHKKRLLDYARSLEAAGKYQVMIWPPHCLIGTWGHNVYTPLADALRRWEEREVAVVDYITKGTNVFVEHYGGLMAEAPDPNDVTTQLNTDFLQTVEGADIIGLCGEASSHCVLTTIQQVVDNIGEQHLGKLHILKDAMSPVPQSPGAPDFPAIAEQFLKDMQSRGLKLTTTEAFLA